MERTTMEDGVVTLGDLEFTGLMKQLIGTYKFRFNNESPEKVIFPSITEIDGVIVEYPVAKKAVKKEATDEQEHTEVVSRLA